MIRHERNITGHLKNMDRLLKSGELCVFHKYLFLFCLPSKYVYTLSNLTYISTFFHMDSFFFYFF